MMSEKERIIDLENELKISQDQLSTTQLQLSDSQSQMSALQAELMMAKSDLRSRVPRRQLVESETRCFELQQALANATGTTNTTNYSPLMTGMNNNGGTLDQSELTNTIKDLNRSLESSEQKLRISEQHLKEHETLITECTDKLQDTESRLRDSESKLRVCQSRLKVCESEAALTESRLTETSKQLAIARTEISSLKERLLDFATTQTPDSSTIGRVIELESQLSDVRKQLASTQSELERKRQTHELSHDFKPMSAQSEYVRELELQLSTLQKQLKERQGSMSGKAEVHAKMLLQMAEMERQMTAMKSHTQSLNSDTTTTSTTTTNNNNDNNSSYNDVNSEGGSGDSSLDLIECRKQLQDTFQIIKIQEEELLELRQKLSEAMTEIETVTEGQLQGQDSSYSNISTSRMIHDNNDNIDNSNVDVTEVIRQLQDRLDEAESGRICAVNKLMEMEIELLSKKKQHCPSTVTGPSTTDGTLEIQKDEGEDVDNESMSMSMSLATLDRQLRTKVTLLLESEARERDLEDKLKVFKGMLEDSSHRLQEYESQLMEAYTQSEETSCNYVAAQAKVSQLQSDLLKLERRLAEADEREKFSEQQQHQQHPPSSPSPSTSSSNHPPSTPVGGGSSSGSSSGGVSGNPLSHEDSSSSSRLRSLETRVREYESQLSEAHELLEQTREQLLRKISQGTEINRKLLTAQSELNQFKNGHDPQHRETEEKLLKINQDMLAMKMQLSQSHSQLAHSTSQLSSMQGLLKASEDKYSSMELRAIASSQEAKETHNRCVALEKELAQTRDKAANLQLQLGAQKQQDIDNMSTSTSTAAVDMRKTLAATTAQMTATQTQLNVAEEKIAVLSAKLLDMTTSRDEANRELAQVRHELLDMRCQHLEMQSKLSEAISGSERIGRIKSEESDKFSLLQGQLTDAKAQYTSTRNQLFELKSVHAELFADLEQAKIQLKERDDQIVEKNMMLEKCNIELIRLESRAVAAAGNGSGGKTGSVDIHNQTQTQSQLILLLECQKKLSLCEQELQTARALNNNNNNNNNIKDSNGGSVVKDKNNSNDFETSASAGTAGDRDADSNPEQQQHQQSIISDLNEQLYEAKNAVLDVKTRLLASENDRLALEKELTRCQKSLHEMKALSEEETSQLVTTGQQQQQPEATRFELKKELEALTLRLQDTEERLAEKDINVTNSSRQLIEAKKVVLVYQDQSRDLEQQLKRAQDALMAERERHSQGSGVDQKTIEEELSSTKAILKSTEEELQRMVEKLEESYASQPSAESGRQTFLFLRNENTELKRQFRETTDELSRCRVQYTQTFDKLRESELRLQRFETEVGEQFQSYEDQLEQSKQKARDGERRLQRMEHQLRERDNSFEAKIEDTYNQLLENKKRLHEANDKLRDVQDRLQSKQDECTAAEGNIVSLEKTLSELKLELGDTTSQMLAVEADALAKARSLNELESQLFETDIIIRNQEVSLQDYKERLRDSNLELAEVRKQLKEALDKVSELDGKLHMAHSPLLSLRLSDTKRELETLRAASSSSDSQSNHINNGNGNGNGGHIGDDEGEAGMAIVRAKELEAVLLEKSVQLEDLRGQLQDMLSTMFGLDATLRRKYSSLNDRVTEQQERLNRTEKRFPVLSGAVKESQRRRAEAENKCLSLEEQLAAAIAVKDDTPVPPSSTSSSHTPSPPLPPPSSDETMQRRELSDSDNNNNIDNDDNGVDDLICQLQEEKVKAEMELRDVSLKLEEAYNRLDEEEQRRKEYEVKAGEALMKLDGMLYDAEVLLEKERVTRVELEGQLSELNEQWTDRLRHMEKELENEQRMRKEVEAFARRLEEEERRRNGGTQAPHKRR
eukprot:gene76-93_t